MALPTLKTASLKWNQRTYIQTGEVLVEARV